MTLSSGQVAPAPPGFSVVAARAAGWARVGDTLLLLILPVATAEGTAISSLRLAGAEIEAPIATRRLVDADGALLLAALRDPARIAAPGTPLSLSDEEGEIAALHLGEEAEAEALCSLLPEAQRSAALQFLARNAAGLFGSEPGLAVLVHRLAMAEAGDAAASPLSRPGRGPSLWSVPQEPAGSWLLLEPGRIRRLGPAADGLLVLWGTPSPRALLLPPGPPRPPLRLARGEGVAPLDAMVRAAVARGAVPAERMSALAALARRSRPLADFVAEAQLLAPARPAGTSDPLSALGGSVEAALADHGGGIFLAGWLRDPLDLVAALELRSPFAARAVPFAALHRVQRPDLAEPIGKAAFGAAGPPPGFLAHLPEADDPLVAQWRLALRLRSGERIELLAPPARLPAAACRDFVLQAIDPGALVPGVLEACMAPAVARLQRAALAQPGTPEVVRIGATPPARPRAAVIVPLWRNMRFLRTQLSVFARDRVLRGCEIVYVLDSPEQRGEVELLLRGMATLFEGLAVTLVVMPANLGYASACNAGAAASRAPILAMLNSDVVPFGPGWLEPLLARLAGSRRLAAVGPKLLFEDGLIQHAGMCFRRGPDGRWYNEHFHKGLARSLPAACVAREVPAVTGAALVVRRRAFAEVGGFSVDYVLGDFEDSDLCLALRAAGHAIGYEPASELVHFERQSIAGHAGHARTLAGAYNRFLHHTRWDAAIDRLMRRFDDRGAA